MDKNTIDGFLSKYDFGFEFFGNSGIEYVVTITAVVILGLAIRLLRRFCLPVVKRLAGRTETEFDDTLVEIAEIFFARKFAYFLAFVVSVRVILDMPEKVDWTLGVLLTLWIAIKVCIASAAIIDLAVGEFLSIRKNDREKGKFTFIGSSAKILACALVAIVVLDNYGFDVMGFLIPWAVGGIGLSVAAQGIIKNSIAASTIHFDEPFAKGDHIESSGVEGVVEKIGKRTTTIRAFSKEAIHVPNNDLVNSTIRNYGMRDERRVQEKFTLGPDESVKTIEHVKNKIKEIVTKQDGVRFGHVFVKSIDNNGCGIGLTYYVTEEDYEVYLAIIDKVILEIKSMLEEEKITLPNPKHTVHLKSH